MDFNEYQDIASKLAVQSHDDDKETEMHWALGLGEEAGEVLGVVKHRHYGGDFQVDGLAAELGDVLWYLSSMCTAFGIRLQDVAAYNIAKLMHRYPSGDFDGDRSVRRHELDKEFKSTPTARAMAMKMNNDYDRSRKRKENAE